MSIPPQDINLGGVLSETRLSKIKAYTTYFIISFSLYFLIPIPNAFFIYPFIFSTSSKSNSTSIQDINLRGVLTETTRILKSYKNHFTVLSLLFLLPFSLLVFIYITISPNGLLQIIYIVAAIFFLISAIGTITYTTFHGYYNQPLELITTIKSLSSSFIPICSTLIVLLLINILLIGIPGILLYNMVLGEFYFILTMFLGEVVAYVSLTYLQLHFIIAIVIAVIESKWGYEPLRRSAYLIKGMKKEALIISMMFGVWNYYLLIWNFYFQSKYATWGLWMLIYQITTHSMSTMVLLLVSNLTAPVVLYIYSKEKHGEKIQPEECVSLPSEWSSNKYVDIVVQGLS